MDRINKKYERMWIYKFLSKIVTCTLYVTEPEMINEKTSTNICKLFFNSITPILGSVAIRWPMRDGEENEKG